MELRSEQIVMGNNAGKLHTIVCGTRNQFRIIRINIIAMHKIETTPIIHPFPERMCTLLLDPIPTHLRYLQLFSSRIGRFGKMFDATGNQAQQIRSAIFIATPHQHRQSHADTKEGFAVSGFQHSLIEVVIGNCCHTIARSTLTGKNHPVGIQNQLWIIGDMNAVMLVSNVLNSLGDRAQITHAIVNDCNRF